MLFIYDLESAGKILLPYLIFIKIIQLFINWIILKCWKNIITVFDYYNIIIELFIKYLKVFPAKNTLLKNIFNQEKFSLIGIMNDHNKYNI